MKWNEHQLETRDLLVSYFTRYLVRELNKINTAFRFMRIETPILLPFSVAAEKLQVVQIRLDNEELVLRQNTVTGAYEASRDILTGKAGPKQKLTIVIWQHGKVFERINGVTKEKYHLEYQVLFSKTTGMPYEPIIAQACANMVYKQCGPTKEDAKPGMFHIYAEDNNDLLASLRERDDFWAGKNIEVVLNLDNCTLAAIRQEKRTVKKRTMQPLDSAFQFVLG
jgi:hypothetical protein